MRSRLMQYRSDPLMQNHSGVDNRESPPLASVSVRLLGCCGPSLTWAQGRHLSGHEVLQRRAKSDTSSSLLRQRLRDVAGPSIKSCATGFSVRVFRVKIPTGKRVGGSSTGKTLHSSRFLGNCNVESANIVR